MNVETITMDKDLALKKLAAYRKDKHKDAEEQYKRCADAYEALAKGTPLIDLPAAIRAGGFFPEMRPKLAVCRADAKEVQFNWRGGAFWTSFTAVDHTRRKRSINRVDVDMQRRHDLYFKGRDGTSHHQSIEGFALVPMLPADVRPKTGLLKHWHILWEVEQWSDRSLQSPAPRDPFLLKRVAGDLWAVLAEWDLTELERTVMAGLVQTR